MKKFYHQLILFSLLFLCAGWMQTIAQTPTVVKNEGFPNSISGIGVAFGASKYVATTTNGIISTSSDGYTWTRTATLPNGINALTFAYNLFIAVGDDGYIATSPDGVTWTIRTSGTLNGLYAAKVLNGKLLVVGTNRTMLTSNDAINWSTVAVNVGDATDQMLYLTYGNGMYMIGARQNGTGNTRLYHSTTANSNSWSFISESTFPGEGINSVQWLNDRFYIFMSGAAVFTSTNGTSWTNSTSSITITYPDNTTSSFATGAGNQAFNGVYDGTRYIIYGSSSFLGSNAYGAVFVSTNGVNFTLQPRDHYIVVQKSEYLNSKFFVLGNEGLAVSDNGLNYKIQGGGYQAIVDNGNSRIIVGQSSNNQGAVFSTPDMVNVTSNTNTFFAQLNGLTWSGSQYVAVGASGQIATSPDGTTWTYGNSGDADQLRSVAFGNGVYVAVGNQGKIMRSTNGTSWTQINKDPSTGNNFNSVRFLNGRFIAVGGSAATTGTPRLAYSTDGSSWTTNSPSFIGHLQDITWDGTQYVIIGRENSSNAAQRQFFSYRQSDITVNTISSFSSVPASSTGNVPIGNANFGAIAYSSGTYVAIQNQNAAPSNAYVLYSSDAINWTVYDPNTTSRLRALTASGSRFSIVGLTSFTMEMSFASASSAPTVSTGLPTTIQATSAAFSGQVTADGGATVSARGFVYGTTQNPTLSNTVINSGSGIGAFTESASGLAPNTLFYVRAFATNSVGTSYGSQQSFTTLCQTSTSDTTITACGSYVWNGTTYTTGGTYTRTFTGGNAIGCDSIATLNLTITTPLIPSISLVPSQTSICAGASVTFTASATNGGSSPLYDFRLNNVSVQNSSTATYTSSTLANNDVVTVVLTANNACQTTSTANSSDVTITVDPTVTPSVTIAANPGNTITSGTSVTFTATPTNGGTTPTYQWKKNNNNVGTNSATYTDNSLANGDVITVELTSNALCANPTTATSSGITMTVNANCVTPISYLVTGGGAYCSGQSGVAVGLANSETGVSYQLRLSGTDVGTAVNGTGSAISFGNQTAAGTYTVLATRITGGCTAPMGDDAVVTVNPTVVPSVTIAANPGNTITSGTSVTFTATPTNGGTTPTYQWKKNNNNVGTNSVTYTDNSLANGDVITVELTSNALCANPTAATSSPINVTVTAPPCVFTPSNINVAHVGGGLFGFSGPSFAPVVYTPNGNLNGAPRWSNTFGYIIRWSGAPNNRWEIFDSNSNFVAAYSLSAGTISNLPCSNTQWFVDENYAGGINLSGGCGSLLPPFVTPSVTIAANPGNTITSGTSVTFTATPTNGGTTPTYQWKKNNSNVGTNSATYTDNALANQDSVWVELTSSDACANPNTAVSTRVMMTVNSSCVTPTSYLVTGGGAYCAGQSGVAVGLANSETGVSYQLRLGGTDVGAAVNGTGSAISFGNQTAAGTYTVLATRITGGCTAPMGDDAVVTVTPNVTPTVSLASTADTICAGTSVTFTATANNGGASPAYDFRLNGVSVQSGSTSTYTSTALANSDTISVVLTANNTCQTTATATSSDKVMTVTTPVTPSVVLASTADTICAGTSVTFTATANNGGASPVYDFRLNGVSVQSGSTSTYTSATLANSDTISVVLTANNTCQTAATATSSDKVMTVTAPVTPTVTLASTADTICAGTSVTFTATSNNGGSSPVYDFRLNGVSVQSGSTSTYTNTTLANSDTISVVLTANNTCQTAATATSTDKVMTVTAPVTPTVTLASTADTICAGTSVTFTATSNNGGSSPVYDFRLNGVSVQSGSTSTYTSATLANSDTISVVLTANNTCQTAATATSSDKLITVTAPVTPTVTLASTADTICAGTSVTFTATSNNGGTSPVYDFRLNGVSVQSGSTSTYTSTALANSDTISVVLTANNTCQTTATATSTDKVMTVTAPVTPTVSLASTADTICAGTSVTFTATANNGGTSPVYDFRLNGVSVQSGSTSTYTSTALANSDTIRVVLTANNTCQTAANVSSSNKVMVVRALPVVSITQLSNMPVSEDSIAVTGTPAGGTLSGPGLLGGLFRPWTVDTGLVTLTYSFTSAQGCSATATTTFRMIDEAIVWDGTQWKYGIPGSTQGSRDLMVLVGNSPAIPNGTACRTLVLRGGALTHSLNNVLTINRDLRLRGGSMIGGGGTLRFVNANALVSNASLPIEFKADIEVANGANVQNVSTFRLAPGSNVMAGTGTPNGGGTTSGTWTIVQRGTNQAQLYNAFSSPVVNGTGRMIQGLQHFQYQAATQTLLAWDSNLVMEPGRGYLARIATNGWFRGALNNGNLSVPVIANTAISSWNLLGNPYPSQLDLADFFTQNTQLNGAAYFLSNLNTTSEFVPYNALTGYPTAPVAQGFFVDAVSSGSVSFNNSMRRAGRTPFFLRTQNAADLVWLRAVTATGNLYQSRMLVGFTAQATSGFDRQYDARMLKSDAGINVFSILNQDALSIQGLPALSGSTAVPLGVEVVQSGNYILRLDSTNLTSSNTIYLEDTQNGVMHNLRTGGYAVNATQPTLWTSRFRLWINPVLTSNSELVNNQPLKLYAFNQTLVIDELQGRRVKEVRLTDLSGRVIENWQQPQGESRIELPTTTANGVYLLTVITTDGTVQTERVLVRY